MAGVEDKNGFVACEGQTSRIRSVATMPNNASPAGLQSVPSIQHIEHHMARAGNRHK